MTFSGSSTLHDFSGHAQTEPFRLVRTLGAEGRTASWAAEVDLRVSGLSTDNGRRDANMRKMLDASTFPTIHGSIAHAPVAADAPVSVPLTLEIRGQRHAVAASVHNWRETLDGVSFEIEFALSLDSFHLKPPSVLGVIKVGDTVNVAGRVTDVPPAPIHAAGPVVKGNSDG
jgi:polyisoprenoid-binding protein YceI